MTSFTVRKPRLRKLRVVLCQIQLQCSSCSLLQKFFLDWITAKASCLDSLLTSSSVSNLFRTSERCGSANFQNSTVRTHYPSAHQPSLAARPRTYLLQIGSYDVSIHPRHRSVLPTVMLHPLFRHDIQTTAAVFYLSSSGRFARSSLYSRQAGVSGFWYYRLVRPASPCRICAVTRGFQTTTHNLSIFPNQLRHYNMTHVLLLPFITTVSTPVVIAIISII